MTGLLKTSSFVLLNGSLNSCRVGTDNFLDLLAALEEQKRGHGANAQLLGNIRALVDVELDELDVRVVFTVLLDLGSNSLARAAPGGVGVDHDELVALDGRVEVGFTEPCQYETIPCVRETQLENLPLDLGDNHGDWRLVEWSRSGSGEEPWSRTV